MRGAEFSHLRSHSPATNFGVILFSKVRTSAFEDED
jgi:hypothetical protein